MSMPMGWILTFLLSSTGTISQWGEVSKAKKPSRPKAKESAPPAASTEQPATASKASRGGRTVSEGGRGRGRATERGARGAARGRTAQPAAPNGARNKENQQLSVPTEESSAWGDKKAPAASKPVVEEKPAAEPATAAPVGKTWASMLRQSTAPKPAPKEAPKAKPAPPVDSADAFPAPGPAQPEPTPEADNDTTPVADRATPLIEEPALPPSKDHLTETNLEQVVDDSRPPATGTAASTAADSWDPRQSPISSSATPISAAQQQHQSQRVPLSGYAASAMKATTDRTNRAPSYQRRVLDQEEAVRMPGNREVDRAAVQFGAFNLNGREEDVDGEREDAETRAQPPAESPVAQPRASLPPVAQHVGVPDTFSKAGAGAPGMYSFTLSQAENQRAHSHPHGKADVTTALESSATVEATETSTGLSGEQSSADNLIGVQPAMPSAQQFNRFGQAAPQDAPGPQKPVDPFNQQAAPVSQPPFDSFPATSQPPAQGAFSSAPGDYSNYYTANQQDRNPYNYYGQQFGQQQGIHGQHDVQQRMGGYNAAQADSLSQYPQSGSSHTQPRFGAAADAQNSGHSTPNPTAQAQQQAQQAQQAQQQQAQGVPGSQPQGHGQQYPGYNHPYYPYYQQYYSGYGQGGFGPYGKVGMYGQPYGGAPNAPYDHASSPANFGPSGGHRDTGLGSGLGDYGRTATSQAGAQPGLGGSSFGGSHDSFARGGSSFQSQGQSFNSQTQPNTGASTDDLKSFGDAKAGAGPSPSLGGARPGSVNNNAPGSQGSGLPPPQASQMGGVYGGYPSHHQGHNVHGSGAYGMGGGAGANQHGNSPYGSYGQGFGSGGYYGGGGQQRGGWGGNYH